MPDVWKWLWIGAVLAPATGCGYERPFRAESACLPEVVAADAPFSFRVFSGCSSLTKFKGLRCNVSVRGLVITVRTPADKAKEPYGGDDACVHRGLDCRLPPLTTGTYRLQFDDWAHELVVAQKEVGPAACAGDPNSGCGFECPVRGMGGGVD